MLLEDRTLVNCSWEGTFEWKNRGSNDQTTDCTESFERSKTNYVETISYEFLFYWLRS